MTQQILIVEDEMLVACDMQDILETNGYRCSGIVPDLASAEEYFEAPIDLALVDLNLRDGLTGPQIGARLGSAGVPVVFVTANPAQIWDGIAGTIGVLSKPTDEATLLATVDYALSRDPVKRQEPPASLKLFA